VNPVLKDLVAILEASGPSLYALLMRLTLRADVAEELFQDLFLRLHHSAGFQQAANRKAYVFRTAINLAVDWRRTSPPRVQSLGSDPPAAEDSPLQQLIDSEDIERILDALVELPTLSGTVVVLRYLHQEDYASIAKQVNKTEHQVRALCAKGLAELRDLMQPADGFREGEVAP
jgi:RNA polymerase sigma factor (sigma-70 family)